MPKNVVCEKCNNLVNDWCEKVIDSPDPDMVRDCRHFLEKTNADRIRAMSDEELADVVANGVGCVRKAPHCRADDCTPCILDWLKQPAESPKEE